MNFLLKSKRMGFRVMESTDLAHLCQLDGDPEVRAFFPTGTLNEKDIQLKIIDNQTLYKELGICSFILIHLEDKSFIGRAGFGLNQQGEVEVSYLLLKKYWNQGLALEALATLLQWAPNHITFTNKIIGFTPIHHFASQRVMERCGMQYQYNDYFEGVECKFYQWNKPK